MAPAPRVRRLNGPGISAFPDRPFPFDRTSGRLPVFYRAKNATPGVGVLILIACHDELAVRENVEDAAFVALPAGWSVFRKPDSVSDLRECIRLFVMGRASGSGKLFFCAHLPLFRPNRSDR